MDNATLVPRKAPVRFGVIGVPERRASMGETAPREAPCGHAVGHGRDGLPKYARHSFTEIGWPFAPVGPAPDSPFGGSEAEQAAFVWRFFELTTGLDLSLALWSFPHDPSGQINPAFLSISLRHNEGAPKPALAVWQEMIINESK